MKLTAAVVAVVFASMLHSAVLQQTPGDRGNLAAQVSTASNNFANNLFKEIGKTGGNVLVCPVSLHVALALLYLGAEGKTATDLNKVVLLSKNDVPVGYKALLEHLSKDNTLQIATKLYPALGYPLKKKFTNTARDSFFSDVDGLDFNEPQPSADIINKFVERKTNGKIHDLISPGSLSGDTRLVIINAVYFQAVWRKTFVNAYDGIFRVTPTKKVPTRLMTITDNFEYKEDSQLQAKVLKMDYNEGDYSMIFVLPNKEGTLPEVEDKLAGMSMRDLLNKMYENKVEVTIPKFSLEMTINLKDTLTKMGLSDLFSPDANLKGITETDNLFVSEVIQKTFINVHENGTEAAAATGFLETLSAIPDSYMFSARHPFHFYLVKGKQQKLVLFEGRLEQPKEITPTTTSDYTTDKEGVEGEKKQDNANGNRNPENNGNRLPGINRYEPQYASPQVSPQQHYNGESAYENSYDNSQSYQPSTSRPVTYRYRTFNFQQRNNNY